MLVVTSCSARTVDRESVLRLSWVGEQLKVGDKRNAVQAVDN